MRVLCLLVAVLMLTGCRTSQTLYVPRAVPPLDSGLAAPCPDIPDSPQALASYDDWQVWVQDTDRAGAVGGGCASRHRETVKAWPK